MKQLFITRHGERIDFIRGSDEFNQWMTIEGNTLHNPSLSSRGYDLAFRLGKHLANNYMFKNKLDDNETCCNSNSNGGVKRLIIFTSPYRRCLETTQSILKGVDEILLSHSDIQKEAEYELYVEYGIAEWFGEKKAFTTENIPQPLEEIKSSAQFKELFLKANNISQKGEFISGKQYESTLISKDTNPFKYFLDEKPIETVEDLETRASIAMKNVWNFVKDENDENVLVLLVSHAASVIKEIEVILPESERNNVKAGICGLSKVDLQEDNSWKLTINSDTSFLDGGDYFFWEFSDYYAYLNSLKK